MNNCRLPQEMVDAVLDNIRGDDGRKALLACSQVCHAWLPSSQRNLFRQISFGVDGGHNKRLCQALLSSPHLAKYIRELEVRLPVGDASHATCQTLSVILDKLSELQRLTLYGLVWHKLTVDLRQSLCRLLLVSPISFVKLDDMYFFSVDNFANLLRHAQSVTELLVGFCFWAQEDQGEQEDEPRLNLHERRHLNLLHFYSKRRYLYLYVDCLLGPRSPLELSHIETLLIDDLGSPYGGVNQHGDTLNRLLHAIGSSLKHLQLYVPNEAWDGSPDFNINLVFNPNIKRLHLTNINLMSNNLAWLLRFLRNIATLNQLDHIVFDVIIGGDTFVPEDSSVWQRVDCLLARNEAKFRQLQMLDIKFCVEDIECVEGIECDERDEVEKSWCDVISRSMVAAYPLLLERGVSVNARCVAITDDDRALWLLHNGYMEEVGIILNVSKSSMTRWAQNLEVYGNVVPPRNPLQGRPGALNTTQMHALINLVQNAPEMFLNELQDWLALEHDILVAITTLHYATQNAGLSYKLLRRQAAERDEIG
ncbi:hypothetical protein JB92DRAFT_3141831 [Gautieria morchelliformis]|nr:hypothetical protein JB92DRAFT_3141831 [Gautieria morchelliformis]